MISNRQRIFEIGMVIITGFGKLCFVDLLDLKFIYIISVILFWCGYFTFRIIENKELIQYWGLSFHGVKDTFKIIGPVGLIFFIGFIIYGFKTIKFNLNIVFVLITYPIWGLIQQFLMMSLFAGNLTDYGTKQINKVLVVVLTSILFSIVHYPSIPLIVATFIMAVFYSTLFLYKRNIIPLGIFHGMLGGMFYYVVLNRDPWLEFISILKK